MVTDATPTLLYTTTPGGQTGQTTQQQRFRSQTPGKAGMGGPGCPRLVADGPIIRARLIKTRVLKDSLHLENVLPDFRPGRATEYIVTVCLGYRDSQGSSGSDSELFLFTG